MRYGAPFRIETKRLDGDTWEVSGYASTYDRDLGDDVVVPGAFRKSLDAGPKVRFLYAHDPGQVLGTVRELKEDDRGLYGRFNISRTALGQDVHTLLKDGALDSFSIGYIPRDSERDEKAGTRRLTEIELLEVSVVAIPMNPAAVVTAVKAVDYSLMDLDELLRVYSEHTESALAQVKAVAERRRAEGRKLSDRALEVVEALRVRAEADAAALLALATAPPDETKDTPATVRAVGLVESHLRRARLNEARRKSGLPPLDLSGASGAA